MDRGGREKGESREECGKETGNSKFEFLVFHTKIFVVM